MVVGISIGLYGGGTACRAALRRFPDLIETKMSVPDQSGVITDTISLTATLTTLADDPVADAEVAFGVDGTAVGSDTTDATGLATVSYTIPSGPPGDVSIDASFAGDATYAASSGSGTLTRQQVDTKLYVPNRTGEVNGSVVLRGYLLRLDNTPVPGRSLTFKVNDVVVGSAVTDANGRAESIYSPIPPGPGSRTIRVEWAGDDGYRASFGTGTLYVDKNAVYIVVMPRTTRPGDIFRPRALMRRLPDYTPLAGKTLTFKVDGTSIGTAVTGTDGIAMPSFGQTTAWTAGSHTCSAEFAGDDLLVPGSGSAPFNVLPGISFANPVLYSVPTPQQMAAAHLDGDDFLDLIVPSMDGNVYILWGRGDGTFDSAVPYPAGQGGHDVIAVDLDGDGRLDIVVCEKEAEQRIAVLKNYGGRTFSAATFYVLGRATYGVSAGDIDGDGAPDLAVTCQWDNKTAILRNNGDGTFGAPTYLPSFIFYPWYPLLTDFNGDGYMDVVLSGYDNRIQLYAGNGSGGFTDLGHISVGNYPMWIARYDMDGDGLPDLVFSNYWSDAVSILFATRKRGFRLSPLFPAGPRPYTLHCADVDRDGRMDVLVGNGETYGRTFGFTVLRNLGGGILSAPFRFDGAGADAKGTAVGDFNRDGRADMATSSNDANAVGVSLNTTP